MATSSDAAGAKKGKGKVKLSLAEEVKQADQRRSKEAGRQQSYRNDIDRAYDELFMAMYGDEEEAKLARAAHGKRGCLKKAVEMLGNIEKEKHALQERIEALTHSKKVQDAQVAALTHQLRQSQEQMERD
ncbi:hypothetical protein EWM64_g6263 [Hericium alpestre]|uniref:BHLH domain-containing protein n=1 Tax=Hericium alpestre TaxID=135208 RepID=A0A4Y9ZS98_9AGAM|nr:hypothetical protein EWM64_g6263 [Hericium alpestre]